MFSFFVRLQKAKIRSIIKAGGDSMKERLIFHIDVNNAFLSWSAVLLLKQGYKQDIRKIPSIIGGDESKRHGIVLAKSPIAKRFGVVTAETLYSAKKKCPTLQIFSPNYEWYYEKSRELMKYLSQYTPVMEQFSVDECFLDMTGTSYLYKDYIKLAYFIKDDIKKKFGYTVNVGIGNNKLCAKMASDFEKPDKVHTLLKGEIKDKLWPLPVKELFMVGKKTALELQKLNIKTVKDLAESSDALLYRHFKNQSTYLKEAANGIDLSKVEARSSKHESISISETLPYDYEDEEKLKEVLFRQTEEVSRELRYKKQYTKTVAVIFKNNRFISYSAQAGLFNATDKTEEIYKTVKEVFENNWKEDPIRLIGVRLANLTEKREKQLSLFDENNEKAEDDKIQKTLDEINRKYGGTKIAPASLKLLGEQTTKNKYKNHE